MICNRATVSLTGSVEYGTHHHPDLMYFRAAKKSTAWLILVLVSAPKTKATLVKAAANSSSRCLNRSAVAEPLGRNQTMMPRRAAVDTPCTIMLRDQVAMLIRRVLSSFKRQVATFRANGHFFQVTQEYRLCNKDRPRKGRVYSSQLCPNRLLLHHKHLLEPKHRSRPTDSVQR